MTMKLFVWIDPYHVPYGSSMLFAAAETEAEAMAQALRGRAYRFGEEEIELVKDGIVAKLGPPTRVVDLPCAEWHSWAE